MLDYHLHLWPHTQRDVSLSLAQVADYCERARAAGVVEVALTEHLFRFRQVEGVARRFWADDPDPRLARSMGDYFDFHARSDLDDYVQCALAAKEAGLPVVVGLEVDYYRGAMDAVADLLAGYPFDVLLGSVHWLGTWRFDDLGDTVSMAEWDVRSTERAWDEYTEAMEELAASGACDVLAHPDLIKVTGRRPAAPEEWWDRLAEAAAAGGLAAEVSSAGWRKPVAEAYPAPGLLARFVAAGVPLTTASDAHHLEHVADRPDELRALVAGAGVSELCGFRARRPHPVALPARAGTGGP